MSKLVSFTAETTEVDDGEQAARDILTQLPLDRLKQNTRGIVACHYEFALSGALKAVADALPFEIVGTISSAQGTAQETGAFVLTLTVLTSDEVEFATALSEPLTEGVLERVNATYAAAHETLGVDPDLILLHAPYMLTNNGDDYLAELDRISGRAPLFGTLAVDDTEDFRYCLSIHNGITYHDCMVLTLVKGVKPHFYSANISPNKIVGTPVLVTASEGAFLAEVNDRSIAEYLADLGLATLAQNGYAMSSMPFILDYGDGTLPISRVFIQLTPDGKAILNGSAPVGAQLSVGAFDKEDTLATTHAAVDEALGFAGKGEASVLLIYSCIARSLALGVDYLLELERVKGQVAGALPFMMAYSGGEYCPTELASAGGSVNRFHNNALIICVL